MLSTIVCLAGALQHPPSAGAVTSRRAAIGAGSAWALAAALPAQAKDTSFAEEMMKKVSALRASRPPPWRLHTRRSPVRSTYSPWRATHLQAQAREAEEQFYATPKEQVRRAQAAIQADLVTNLRKQQWFEIREAIGRKGSETGDLKVLMAGLAGEDAVLLKKRKEVMAELFEVEKFVYAQQAKGARRLRRNATAIAAAHTRAPPPSSPPAQPLNRPAPRSASAAWTSTRPARRPT
jgi:hypothetical protein